MNCARLLHLAAPAVLAALLAGGEAAHAAVNPPAPKGASNSTSAKGQTNAAPAEAPIPASVFVIPKSPPGDGVDPFYPQSVRLAKTTVSTDTNRPPERAELVIKGFSGKPVPQVIINNGNFAVNDERDVQTPQGRVRIRCLEIRLEDKVAIILVNGERRELFFRPGK